MEFNQNKPIYLQIADGISEKILSGELKEGDRILSVRELGGELGVNPNTAMRSYEKLTMDGIIYNQRGIGYFVCADAKKKLLKGQKEDFKRQQLPELFRQARMLGISIEEIVEVWNNGLSPRPLP
jgi:DNA-binding transcriptional regulator YhcF (GntR family)